MDIFREHFKNFTDKYVLIGGVACSEAMVDTPQEFRTTKDLDIVLLIETHDTDFVKAFWDFIEAGGYTDKKKSPDKKQFYRFTNPTNKTYPVQLELFSRRPDILDIQENAHLTPLPVDDDLSSLSAILLDDNYYEFIQSGKEVIKDLSILGPGHLIPLKIKAYAELKQRKDKGERIDSHSIKKHRNDVFRLVKIIVPTQKIKIGDPIAEDISNGLKLLVAEENIDQTSKEFSGRSIDETISILTDIYMLNG